VGESESSPVRPHLVRTARIAIAPSHATLAAVSSRPVPRRPLLRTRWGEGSHRRRPHAPPTEQRTSWCVRVAVSTGPPTRVTSAPRRTRHSPVPARSLGRPPLRPVPRVVLPAAHPATHVNYCGQGGVPVSWSGRRRRPERARPLTRRARVPGPPGHHHVRSNGIAPARHSSAVRAPPIRTVNTGTFARRTTRSVVLPRSARCTPRRPCVAITIRSTPCSSAYSTI